jgi:hypothetical protein
MASRTASQTKREANITAEFQQKGVPDAFSKNRAIAGFSQFVTQYD